MEDLRVPIHIEDRHGIGRRDEPVRLGVPLPQGLLSDADATEIVDHAGRPVSHQTRVLAWWPDRSIKWLLLDMLVSVEARGRSTLFLQRLDRATDRPSTTLHVSANRESLECDTGSAVFTFARHSPNLLDGVRVGGAQLLSAEAARLILTDDKGRRHVASLESAVVEEAGPMRVTLLCVGRFSEGGSTRPLELQVRISLYAGRGLVAIDLRIRNPRAAQHPGNLWDLGDAGSLRFKDLSLEIHPQGSVQRLDWYAEVGGSLHGQDAAPWALYQDSSGGESWNSTNHVDDRGRITVSFRGFRVQGGPNGANVVEGLRADPGVTIGTASGCVAATVEKFWQNFPKSLRWRDGALQVALFPAESAAPFELQGGEQKRHTVWLEFGEPDSSNSLPAMQRPLAACVDPVSVERSKALACFMPADRDRHSDYSAYVQGIVDGPHAFAAKREIIDEYGWRNYGDLYADHEAVNRPGLPPLVSHYNNQYDFIQAAATHFLRTGDRRWYELMSDAARHTIDIDIYHTKQDRPAYNGGFFWHTDHYKDAATCTHRTFSRRNGAGRSHGGGPANEHNYTSGLLHYHYLTGDPEAREAVIGLADWVVAMDDGTRTLHGVIDARPTGAASCTASPEYHKPGRGAGNSINALLDAYALTGERSYFRKAEELVRRCIHPQDDIAALKLDEPEHRWSYLVFLQVLGKYLETKREYGETDYEYYYARDSLLHYADWMLEHEVSYKDVLHRVLIPTETWPAQDIRKCHVLHLAATYSQWERRGLLAERAGFFFDRCLSDLLSFDTAYLTRPQVLLAAYGHVHGYFLEQVHGAADDDPRLRQHGYSFGNPQEFVSQRVHLKAAVREKLLLARTEVGRLVVGQWRAFKQRWFESRRAPHG